ncbi:mitochondrial calcium uniporter regulator 1 isoform 3-T3 [Cyanocitta cristata]
MISKVSCSLDDAMTPRFSDSMTGALPVSTGSSPPRPRKHRLAETRARPRRSSRRGCRVSRRINRRRWRRHLPCSAASRRRKRDGACGGSETPGRRVLGDDVSISVSSSLQSKENISLLGNRRLYFDTHALVCLLEANGFTTQQSEVIVSALVKIMNTNLDMIYKDMVTKVQQEIALQQVMSHIGGVKKDMIILEKSEFSALRSENEKIKLELQQIKKQVMDEITKVRADNKLNLNLEKSRVKELHAQQDRALTQTDRKIDTEVADLKTMLESHKLDNIKYLAGSVFTCLTVALGFYRLWI